MYALLAATDPVRLCFSSLSRIIITTGNPSQALLRACRALISHYFGKQLSRRDKALSRTKNGSAVRGINTMVVEVELSTMYSSPDEGVHPTMGRASSPKDHASVEDRAIESVTDNTNQKVEPLSSEPPFRGLVPVEHHAEERHSRIERESDEDRASFHRQI